MSLGTSISIRIRSANVETSRPSDSYAKENPIAEQSSESWGKKGGALPCAPKSEVLNNIEMLPPVIRNNAVVKN